MAGSQPHRECFGKIFSGVSLRVPRVQIEHIFPAAGLRLIPAGVARPIRSENFIEFATGMKPERIAQRVTGLMPEYAHAFILGAALDFEHLRTFQSDQSWMNKVEGNRKTGDAVRCEPLFGQPDVRSQLQFARSEFFVKASKPDLKPCALDF